MHLCEIPNGTSETIWLILEFFADLNIKDNLGNTALHYAFKNDNKHMIIALLLFGANPEISNNEDKKPVDMSKITKDEIDPVIEKITKLKINFLQMTRKRRKKIKKMFDHIDNDNSKTIGEHKLKV
jgi:ankyrin repeat protein